MFAGSCHDWRPQLVLQYRVQVTRTQGNIRVMSPMQPMWVFYSLRNYYFHILMNCKIYMLFNKSEPIVCWIHMFLMIWVLSSMLNLSMIFWRIEYCMWSVKWIMWLCAAVGSFEYCNWCLRNWCCGMFVDLGVLS